MKSKLMKIIPVILLIGLIAPGISGCSPKLFPKMKEIDQFQMIQIVGLDKCSKKPELIEVTLLSKIGKGSDPSGGGDKQLVSILSSKGYTAHEAIRKLKSHIDKILFFGHVEYFIIGEEIAKEDFSKCIDIISRDPEVRYTPKVYIARGGMAKELLNETSSSDKFIQDRLDSMDNDINTLSLTAQVSINEIISMLNNPYSATVIPAIHSTKPEDERILGGEKPEKDITIAGYAIIKDFKLAGYIDPTYSRGYNFLINEANSCPVSVKDMTGNYVGLEITDVVTKVKSVFKGDNLEKVIYETYISSNIEEQHSRQNLKKEEILNELADRQSEIIKKEMEQVIDKAKELEIDCTFLADKVRMQHPIKWEKIKDRWVEIYKDLNIEIKVNSKVIRTYDIDEPSGFQIGD